MRSIGNVVVVGLALIGLAIAGCGDKQTKKGGKAAKGNSGTEPGSMKPPGADMAAVASTKDAMAVAEGSGPGSDSEAGPGSGEEAVADGVLTSVKGSVFIRRAEASEFQPVKETEAKVFAGDSVRVGNDGEATLSMFDQSSVELTPDSAVSIHSSETIKGNSPAVTVLSGAVRFDVEKRAEGEAPFSIYTASSVVNVQGTSLAVGVGLSGTSRVAVESGTVDVTSAVNVDLKPTPVSAGKMVVVATGKPPLVAGTYDPKNADWDKWLEAEEKKGAAQAAILASKHADSIQSLSGDGATLDQAEEEAAKKADTLTATVAAVEKKKDPKKYISVQPKVVDALERQEVIRDQRQLTNARVVAHAYLLRLLHARAAAHNKKLERITAAMNRVGSALQGFWQRRVRRQALRRRRLRRLRRAYHRHSAVGRRLAARRGYRLSAFLQRTKLRRRARQRKLAIRGWKRRLWRRPRYRGVFRRALRREANRFRRVRAWWRKKAYLKRQKQRHERLAARRRAWRRAVVAQRRRRLRNRPRLRRTFAGWKWRIKRRLRRGLRRVGAALRRAVGARRLPMGRLGVGVRGRRLRGRPGRRRLGRRLRGVRRRARRRARRRRARRRRR